MSGTVARQAGTYDHLPFCKVHRLPALAQLFAALVAIHTWRGLTCPLSLGSRTLGMACLAICLCIAHTSVRVRGDNHEQFKMDGACPCCIWIQMIQMIAAASLLIQCLKGSTACAQMARDVLLGISTAWFICFPADLCGHNIMKRPS